MKEYNFAILGATGAVGQEMIKVLEELQVPIKELTLLASPKSVGKKVVFNNQVLTIKEANQDAFEGIDIVLSAVENDIAATLIPYAVKEGALVIDNSSFYRLDDNVPLVIPEVNPKAIKNHKGIIANPNCSTIIGLVAINKLHEYAHLQSMIVSTYQAVSGAGNPGIFELEDQIRKLSNNEEITPTVFPHQIAFNLIPQIGDFDEFGYSSEEMKMQNEGRKILNNPELKVNCTCVRVPILRSHSESMTLHFQNKIDVKKAKELLKNAPGVKLVDNLDLNNYPMPLDTSNQDLIYVGRIREDLSSKDNKSLTLWCCGDQVRKGAASNAIQIAIEYIKQNSKN